ncbi:MAG: hypothetical protein NWE88_02015 [Candidatus Bathyarchaeota archaeon]|nr:hypothetical protein [Candidatus Bathyarchaeota archaeon]
MLMKIFVGVAAGAGIVYYQFSPSLAIVILMAAVIGIGFWIKSSGAWVFMEPGKPGKTPMLWVKKTGKIVPLLTFDKAQGYQALPDWGVVRVTQGSDKYWMSGKRVMIGIEGVSHTVKMEDIAKARSVVEAGHTSLKKKEKEKHAKKK